MGISQLTHSVLNDGILFMATVPPEVTAVSEETDWLPLWTAIIGAGAVLAGTWLNQIFSSRNEKARLTAQNDREDKGTKREELKALYTELIRAFDELLRTNGHLRKYQEVIEERIQLRGTLFGQSKTEKDYLDKRDALEEQKTLQEASIASTLATIDLVGDRMVFSYALVYFGRIRKFDPNDKTSVDQAVELKVWMKDVMRASLAGEPLPSPGNLEMLDAVNTVFEEQKTKMEASPPQGK